MGLGHNNPWVESHMWPQQMWGQRSSRGQWPLLQVFCKKKGHCIHILWCIVMGLGHNDPWLESHIRPQQMCGQRSSRGQWPLVQGFAKTVTVSTYFDVFYGETRGSRTTLFVTPLPDGKVVIVPLWTWNWHAQSLVLWYHSISYDLLFPMIAKS